MNFIESIVLSVVEGITEFLPISSTAHLILTSQILGVSQTDFVKSFEVIIQLGAILAVVALYFKELSRNTQLWYKTILAFLPSAIIGFFLYDFIKERLIGNGLVTTLALILGGLVFTVIDKLVDKTNRSDKYTTNATNQNIGLSDPHVPTTSHYENGIPNIYNGNHAKKYSNPRLIPPTITPAKELFKNLSVPRLLVIGVFQSLAVVPGVSRSAASIFGGLLMGLNKTEAIKFSFFLAIPTMLAATSLDLYKSNFNFSSQEVVLLIIGFVGSFITALFAVKLFINFVQKHSFLPFGIYRIVLGLAWLTLL